MNRKRLQILKLALHRFKESPGNLRFDLSMWITLPDEYRNENPVMVVSKALSGANYCGTTACACGLAASLPSFRRDGLTISTKSGVPRPRYRGQDNIEAVAIFFEIPVGTAMWLFDPSNYGRNRGPITVARRIQNVLDGDAPAIDSFGRVA